MVATLAECVTCGKWKAPHSKGRCHTCYSRAWRKARAKPSGPREPCRHCKAAVSIPGRRGLCWCCHGDPAVRGLYPRGTRRSELTDAEILAIPVLPHGDEDARPDPVPKWAPREGRTNYDPSPHWRAWLGATAGATHPDTDPAAIADAQRRDVFAARDANPGASVAEIADAVVLSEWRTRQYLGEG